MTKIILSLFDEKDMINHESIEMMLIQIKVDFLPNFSKKYPESKPPTGLEIAVIEANHDASETDNLISVLCSFSNGSVVAG